MRTESETLGLPSNIGSFPLQPSSRSATRDCAMETGLAAAPSPYRVALYLSNTVVNQMPVALPCMWVGHRVKKTYTWFWMDKFYLFSKDSWRFTSWCFLPPFFGSCLLLLATPILSSLIWLGSSWSKLRTRGFLIFLIHEAPSGLLQGT